MKAGFGLWVLCVALAGCGAAPQCTVTGLNLSVTPTASATTPDHTAKAPGNQEQFFAYAQAVTTGPCAVPASLGPSPATWTVSDTVHVQISSAADATNGLATCIGATTTPATLTGTVTLAGFTKSATTMMTCK